MRKNHWAKSLRTNAPTLDTPLLYQATTNPRGKKSHPSKSLRPALIATATHIYILPIHSIHRLHIQPAACNARRMQKKPLQAGRLVAARTQSAIAGRLPGRRHFVSFSRHTRSADKSSGVYAARSSGPRAQGGYAIYASVGASGVWSDDSGINFPDRTARRAVIFSRACDASSLYDGRFMRARAYIWGWNCRAICPLSCTPRLDDWLTLWCYGKSAV